MAMNLFSSPITLFSIALLILVLIAYTFRHFKVSPSKTIFQDIKSKRKLNKKDEKLEKKESKLERKERGIINNIFRFGRKGKNEKAKKLTKKEEKIEQKEEKVEKIKVRKDIKKYKAEI